MRPEARTPDPRYLSGESRHVAFFALALQTSCTWEGVSVDSRVQCVSCPSRAGITKDTLWGRDSRYGMAGRSMYPLICPALNALATSGGTDFMLRLSLMKSIPSLAKSTIRLSLYNVSGA